MDAQLEAQGAAEAQDQQAIINEAAPPAEEPLQGNRLTALSEALSTAAEALSDGQVQAAPEEFGEDLEQIPPQLFAQLTVFAGLAQQLPEAEQYQFDPAAAATTNDGLVEAMAAVGGMGRDKNVKRAMASQGPAPQEEAPPEAAPSDDAGNFIA
jgi:hypothetical protein